MLVSINDFLHPSNTTSKPYFQTFALRLSWPSCNQVVSDCFWNIKLTFTFTLFSSGTNAGSKLRVNRLALVYLVNSIQLKVIIECQCYKFISMLAHTLWLCTLVLIKCSSCDVMMKCKMMMLMLLVTCCLDDTSVKSTTCGSWLAVISKDRYARLDLSASIRQSHSYPRRLFAVFDFWIAICNKCIGSWG